MLLCYNIHDSILRGGVQMSKKADDRLICELFAKHRQIMFKIAFGILHNKSDAEDIVQESFLWIINNLDKISQIPCNKRACYFANITEHLSLNEINKQHTHHTDDIDEHADISSDIFVEKNAVDKITIDEVKQIIRTMSETDRLMLRLYLFEGRSYKEISRIAGISEGNARICVYRARKRLAKLLKEQGIEYEY